MTADDAAGVQGCYLLHLEPRYRHAGHYVGWSSDVGRRFGEHLRALRRSSPLLRSAVAAGCELVLVRVWPGEGRTFERHLHNKHGSAPLCPVCRSRTGIA